MNLNLNRYMIIMYVILKKKPQVRLRILAVYENFLISRNCVKKYLLHVLVSYYDINFKFNVQTRCLPTVRSGKLRPLL